MRTPSGTAGSVSYAQSMGSVKCWFVEPRMSSVTRQVTGTSTSFAVPRFYSGVRSEFAYFRDEPALTQGQFDRALATTPGSDWEYAL